jgi:hypothetical protein
MPEFGAYKEGFGLHKGLKIANYKTIKARKTFSPLNEEATSRELFILIIIY